MPIARMLSLVALLMVGAGCAIPRTMREIESRQAKIESDMAMFYENVADAYFLVGWEFFELAKEQEKAGKTDEADKYYRKAHIFSTFSKELHKNAVEKRGNPSLPLPTPYPQAP